MIRIRSDLNRFINHLVFSPITYVFDELVFIYTLLIAAVFHRHPSSSNMVLHRTQLHVIGDAE